MGTTCALNQRLLISVICVLYVCIKCMTMCAGLENNDEIDAMLSQIGGSLLSTHFDDLISLFMTVTCNPNWPDITAALPSGSDWRHYPSIVGRCFMLKFNAILREITEDGVVLAFVWRVEWQVCILVITHAAAACDIFLQARGLPHVHMLIILETPLLAAALINRIACALFPDPIARVTSARLCMQR